ncbi:hypothetical protein ABKN59_008573 [Abortiporus biennis]
MYVRVSVKEYRKAYTLFVVNQSTEAKYPRLRYVDRGLHMRLQRTCSSSQSLDLSLKTVLEDRLSENISNVKFTQCILDRWRRHQASTPYYENSVILQVSKYSI